MKFSEIIDQASALLQRKGRLRYRSLQREFDLDEETLEDLRDELIRGQRLARDEEGEVLVWAGDEGGEELERQRAGATESSLQSPAPNPQPPASYTPQHLAERIRAEQQAMESRGATDGERKTITALFADLKGSTALIEGLDPEEARAIIDPALQLMMDAVHRYDGYVAQALGDGIFALFGAPIAHEDHPQRALYAALHMQEEMRRYAEKLREEGGTPLQMRVGVNTGEVVVRSIRKDDLHTDYVPVGHSTNLAARMEQVANPGSIVVSEQTYKLTDGYFAFQALGKTKVKGVEEPVPIYEVTGAGPLRTRLQVSVRRGLTRFVGRHSEVEHLKTALAQAQVGHGQIVGVMGEPGLGKSRLLYEFKLTSQRGCLVLETFAVSHGAASPCLPLIELLKGYFQIEPGDEERTRKEKVAGKVLILDRSLEDTLPYLFSLLGIEDPESNLQQMDAQIRRQRTFEALKKLFLRESLNQPLILIFEDLHWIDTETQGVLDTLSESVASAQLLLLVNYRPEYRHEWGQKTYYTQLRLAPLGKAEAGELLTFLLGTDASLTALKSLILEKTDGTPFFMEEVVQTLVEEGTLIGDRRQYRLESTPTDLHISPTVQGVLAARIDRLTAEEKALLQQLVVIGRQFPVSLVKAVVSQSEADVYRLLSSLQGKEYLYEQPAFPESEYLFKHALTQDVAYGSVLQEQRKALHEQTGQAMETLYREKLDDHYSELARHYTQSGNAEKAVEYLHLAGQQAVQRSAHGEAIQHLTTALEVLQTQPATPERNQEELRLQTTLGPALMALKGYGSAEVESVYSRARELCQQVGETPQLFPVLRGLWLLYISRGAHRTALEVAEQSLHLAEQAQAPEFLLEARRAVGNSLVYLGKFPSARSYHEQVLSDYDRQQYRSHAFAFGDDPGVAVLNHTALTLWFLGYPEQARRTIHEARSLAEELSHDLSQAFALDFVAALSQLCREVKATREQAEAAIAVSTEGGFLHYLESATIFRGWALTEAGEARVEEGIAQIRQGLAGVRAVETEIWRPWYLALLAQAYQKAGQTQEGLAMLTEARELVDNTDERFYEAELYRLTGELMLQSNTQTPAESIDKEAEEHFQQALNVARHQRAKSLELRAATSLARLWQSQGKQEEARDLLAPIYNWFTEGFDTADLKDAKALLDELS